MIEVLKGGLRGNRVGVWRERSGVRIANSKTGEVCAEAALRGEDV